MADASAPRGAASSGAPAPQGAAPTPNGPTPNGPTPNGPTPNGPTPNGPTPNGPTPNGPTPGVRARRYAPGHRPFRLRLHGWLRWLHTYISMFSLLAILFFSLTGITLNHPDWSFTNTETKREIKGKLPEGWNKGGKVDWFTVGEFLRSHDGVRGTAQDREFQDGEGSITYKAPGYSADCFFDAKTGSYDLTVSAQGLVGVMNDFHRGTTAGPGWRWLIDVSGALLAIVALTGFGLLYYLKKIRTAAFIVMGVGAIIIGLLMKMAF